MQGGIRRRGGKRIAQGGAVGLAALMALSGCGTAPSDPTLVKAAHAAPRATAPAADQRAAANATTDFGLNLYRALAAGSPDGDLVVSPSSLTNALGMLLPGARGRTAVEMTTVLGDRIGAERFAVALGTLGDTEQSRAEADGASLRESDAVWTQKGYGIQQSYLRTLGTAFGTGAHSVDFKADPEAARRTVNGLVRQQTDGQIGDLFPTGSVTRDTRLVLTDAVYFKAKWQQAFDRDDDADEPFHRLDGSAPTVTMMNHGGSYPYARGTGWQAVQLPYQGGHMAMDVIMPATGDFADFTRSLTASRLTGILGGLTDGPLDLTLPRFTFDSGRTLNAPLAGLGMRTAFRNGPADFSGIPTKPANRLYVQSVVQKAHIAVDEDGTTAAAGSGVSEGAGAAPAPGNRLVVDRPFVFLIRDTRSAQVLFLGQVTNPQATS